MALATLPISYQRPSGPLKASPARALALKAVPAAGHRVRIKDDGNRACGIPRHDVLQIMKNPQSAGLVGLVRDHRAGAQASLEFGYSGIGYRDLISSTLVIQAP